MSKLLTLSPRISEKAYGLSQARNTYVFHVPAATTKQLVAAAVSVQFGVTVTNVNIVNQKGKQKRTVRKGGRPIQGQRRARRQAYVILKAGDNIPVFAALEEPAAEDQPAKKEKK